MGASSAAETATRRCHGSYGSPFDKLHSDVTSFTIRALQALGLARFVKTVKDRLVGWTPAHRRSQRAMERFYGAFIRAGDLVFDVGANVGNRTEIFLRLGARVIAVEPQPFCVAALQRKFGSDQRVTLVTKALGPTAGEGELQVSQAHTLSSMSTDWIETVKASGRFRDYEWQDKVRVEVTTLDRLIAEYGPPAFCKIDVEGFELPVLQGLSSPLAAVSFELTPEYMDSAIACLRQLASLGQTEFNYSIAETMELALPNWIDAKAMVQTLATLPDRTIFGDVYARSRIGDE